MLARILLIVKTLSRGAVALRKAMARRKLTQASVAHSAGTSQGMISRILYGVREPNRRLARWFLEHLGIPLRAWDEPSRECATNDAAE